MDNIASTLRTYFYGKAVTKYREAGDEYDIFLRLKEDDRKSMKDILDVPLTADSGKIISLSNIARVVQQSGPIEIERQNQERVVKVEANTYRRALGDIAKDIREVVDGLKVPEGVIVRLGGDIEEQQKAFKELVLLFILGGLLVYMVMAAQFESLLDPFYSDVFRALCLDWSGLRAFTFRGKFKRAGIFGPGDAGRYCGQ